MKLKQLVERLTAADTKFIAKDSAYNKAGTREAADANMVRSLRLKAKMNKAESQKKNGTRCDC